MFTFKHLRGKHDQKDHGRRAIGNSRTARAISGISSLSARQAESIRELAVNNARSLAQEIFDDQKSTTNEAKLRDSRELMNASMRVLDQFTKHRQKNKRGILVPGLPFTTLDEQRRFIDTVVLAQASKVDYHREQYNEYLAAFQAERKDRRRRKNDAAAPSVDKTTSFVSLDGAGLKGWRRQRPAKAPNYTAFDQATDGEPAWMPAIRNVTQQYDQKFVIPRTFRDITQTPEGKPVRMIIPDLTTSSNPTWAGTKPATQLSDLSIDQVKPEPGGFPQFFSSLWRERVFTTGEAIFPGQNGYATDFWDQEVGPPTSWSSMAFLPVSIKRTVSRYGEYGFREMNTYIRDGRDADAMQNIQDEVQEVLQNKVLSAKERRLIRSTLYRRLVSIEETQLGIAVIDAGMRPAPQTMMVRRGVGKNTFGRMQQELRVGDRFTDDALISASINPTFNWSGTTSSSGAPEGGSPMVNVILTEGTPALWTDGHALGSSENEVIIGRGTTFEVISTDNERGWILRTIPPDGDYVPPPVSTYDSDPFTPEVRQWLES